MKNKQLGVLCENPGVLCGKKDSTAKVAKDAQGTQENKMQYDLFISHCLIFVKRFYKVFTDIRKVFSVQWIVSFVNSLCSLWLNILPQRPQRVSQRTQSLFSDVRKVSTDVRKSFTDVRKSFTDVRKVLTAIRKNLTAIRKNLTAIRKNLTAIRKNLTAIRKNLTDVREIFRNRRLARSLYK
jgi:hypothetical protein